MPLVQNEIAEILNYHSLQHLRVEQKEFLSAYFLSDDFQLSLNDIEKLFGNEGYVIFYVHHFTNDVSNNAFDLNIYFLLTNLPWKLSYPIERLIGEGDERRIGNVIYLVRLYIQTIRPEILAPYNFESFFLAYKWYVLQMNLLREKGFGELLRRLSMMESFNLIGISIEAFNALSPFKQECLFFYSQSNTGLSSFLDKWEEIKNLDDFPFSAFMFIKDEVPVLNYLKKTSFSLNDLFSLDYPKLYLLLANDTLFIDLIYEGRFTEETLLKLDFPSLLYVTEHPDEELEEHSTSNHINF